MENEELYLSDVVSPLLTEPTVMIITRKMDERGICLTLTVAKADMGRVIGREGNTAKAIRTVLRQYGGTMKKIISLVIAEPEGSEKKMVPDTMQELKEALTL